MSKISYLTKLFFFLLLILGIAGILLLEGILILTLSTIIGLAGVAGFLISFGLGKYIPIPLFIKKGLLFNIALPIVGVLGRDEAVLYYSELNNSLNPRTSDKILLLLPSCIQLSGCEVDLEEDTSNCRKCGRCQVAWILENSPEDISIVLVKGGRAATEKIKEIAPSAVVAIACEKELEEGIKKTLSIPVWAVRNLRPEGPCRNTVVLPDEYLKTIERAKEK